MGMRARRTSRNGAAVVRFRHAGAPLNSGNHAGALYRSSGPDSCLFPMFCKCVVSSPSGFEIFVYYLRGFCSRLLIHVCTRI